LSVLVRFYQDFARFLFYYSQSSGFSAPYLTEAETC